jgi:CO/xanthine dehydrogenase Mo-binding subunit
MHLRICPKRLPVKPPCARSTLSWRPSWVSLLAVRWRLSLSSGELIGRGIVAPGRSRAPLGGSTPFWEMAVGAAEVHVDEETGAVVVEEYVPVADIGRSTNPQQCEGQDEGAVMQGLGHTLLEEMVHDGGQLLNANLVDYRVPRAEDLPSRLRCIFVENGDGAGPFGAKGAGEGSLIPVSRAIGNALARLTGVRFRELPLTTERVWRALRARPTACGAARQRNGRQRDRLLVARRRRLMQS